MNKNKINKRIGKNLKNYRSQRGHTLRSLAELIKYTPGYIGLIEQGKSAASIKALMDIANALNVDITHLIEVQKETIDLSKEDPLYNHEDFQQYIALAKNAYLKNISANKLNDMINLIA